MAFPIYELKKIYQWKHLFMFEDDNRYGYSNDELKYLTFCKICDKRDFFADYWPALKYLEQHEHSDRYSI